MFSTLSMHDDVVDAHVRLRAARDEVQCSVRVSLGSRGAIEARASASYAAAAIDRAAGRVAQLIDAPSTALST